jgi:anti-anti-sigma regulatory factor
MTTRTGSKTKNHSKLMAYRCGVSLALVVNQFYLGESEMDMLRITENLENGKTVRLRLDGTLNALSLPELEEICSRHQTEDTKVILLDLAGVIFMTDEIAKKLVELRSDRLRIINCSPFIEMLLKTVER